jgi:hypothetical protein
MSRGVGTIYAINEDMRSMATIRKLFLMLFVLISLAQPSFVWAQALVNSEVNVDISGKDPADARAQAMAKAEADGLVGLLERLGPPGQAKDIMANLDAKKIATMVKGTQIVDEKITANRYRARLLVSFDGGEISKLISNVNTPDVVTNAPATVGSFLVIPALEINNQKLLWEEGNLWKKIWNDVALEVTAGDVLVPFGDTTDAVSLSYEGMLTANYQSLSSFALRYGVSDIVLLQGRYTARPDMVLTVTKRRIGRQDSSVSVRTYRADPQETRDILFARAARDIIAELQEKKTDESNNTASVRGGDRQKVMMLASISTMRSWTELRKKLTSLPMVDRVDTLAGSARQVDIMVYYRGSEESFTNAIVRKSIRLKKEEQYWVISND